MTNRKYRPFRHWKELWTQEPGDQLTALRCMSTRTHIHALQFLTMERAGAEARCSLCIYVGAGDPNLNLPYFTATEPSPHLLNLVYCHHLLSSGRCRVSTQSATAPGHAHFITFVRASISKCWKPSLLRYCLLLTSCGR